MLRNTRTKTPCSFSLNLPSSTNTIPLYQQKRILIDKKPNHSSSSEYKCDTMTLHRMDMDPASETPVSAPPPPSISFVWSYMNLLSGGLNDCQNADDETCSAGIAAGLAFLRRYSDGIDSEGSLVISRLDYQSVFVNMHPLSWGVNRLILHDRFGMDVYFAYRSLLVSSRDDTHIQQRDLSTLQTKDLPALLGNVVVATSNVWSQYAKNIHFDEKTGLAVVFIDDGKRKAGDTQVKGSLNSVSQAQAVRGLFEFVEQENQARGCSNTQTAYNIYMQQRRSNGTDTSGNTVVGEVEGQEQQTQLNPGESSSLRCWIPVVIYDDTRDDTWHEFLHEMLDEENYNLNPHPPALIAQSRSSGLEYPIPQQIGPHGTWVVSFKSRSRNLTQLRLELSRDRRAVTNVTLIEQDLTTIPDEIKDEQFRDDIAYLRTLADEALESNPVRGTSLAMPPAKFADDIRYSPCMGGECPIGNLFTDALRWWTGADFAFLNSGGIRGSGWPEGPVRVGNIWDSLPFANTDCTGSISGINLFRIFRESTTQATFQGLWTSTGDRLFQVSGIRYTYNTELDAPRLIGMEIWDESSQLYKPVERLKVYKFATSSWMCSGFDPFPTMLSEELTVEGEREARIGDTLLQNIVGDYLEYLEEPYDTSIQGRLVNDTNAIERLDFIQTESSCNSSTYWVEQFLTCFDCPTTDMVEVIGPDSLFEVESMSDEIMSSQAEIVNGEAFPVILALKSKPEWLSFISDDIWENGEGQKIVIPSGDSYMFDYDVSALNLSPGLASGSMSFAVLDGGNYPGCVGRDALLPVSMKILNQPELNQTGSIMIVGFTLMSIVLFVTFCLAVWVYGNRQKREVSSMQPFFLVALCFGVSIIGLSILPLSIRGLDVSPRGQDIACMATPWLLTMGFAIVMSALFSKLWRINKIFEGRRFRRITLTYRETYLAFGIILSTNLLLMLLWTFIDPLEFDVRMVEGEEWKLYSTCSSQNGQSMIFLILAIIINFFAMSFAIYEAYKARNISEKFSESKNLGIAIFSWIQITIIGCPVLFLIDEDNVTPKYFLHVALIFVGCMSMLLIIFIPLLLRTYYKSPGDGNRNSMLRVSGLNLSRFSESLPFFVRSRGIDNIVVQSRDFGDKSQQSPASPANTDEFASIEGNADRTTENSLWSKEFSATNTTKSQGSGASSSLPDASFRRTVDDSTRGNDKKAQEGEGPSQESESVTKKKVLGDHEASCATRLSMACSSEMTIQA